VRLFVPAVSAVVENAATPLPFTAELPSWVVPSIKLTAPVGEPALVVTVAVSVKLVELEPAFNAIDVLAFCTVWVITDDVAELKLLSPL
jgi:hypothetical protein